MMTLQIICSIELYESRLTDCDMEWNLVMQPYTRIQVALVHIDLVEPVILTTHWAESMPPGIFAVAPGAKRGISSAESIVRNRVEVVCREVALVTYSQESLLH
jgi:hypothetical protein